MAYQVTVYSKQERAALIEQTKAERNRRGISNDQWRLSVGSDGVCSFPPVILGSHLTFKQKKDCLIAHAQRCPRTDSGKRGMSREEFRCVWFGTQKQHDCFYVQAVSKKLTDAVVREMQREGHWA